MVATAISTSFEGLNNSNANPIDNILLNEFIEGSIKAGSLISMIENKKLNPTCLFSLLLEKPDYRNFFVEITSSTNFREAVLSMLYLYPSLVKSKITKSSIRKLNAKRSNGSRTAPIQQALSGIAKS